MTAAFDYFGGLYRKPRMRHQSKNETPATSRRRRYVVTLVPLNGMTVEETDMRFADFLKERFEQHNPSVVVYEPATNDFWTLP